MKLLNTKLRHYTFVLSEFRRTTKNLYKSRTTSQFLICPGYECTDEHHSASSYPQNYLKK